MKELSVHLSGYQNGGLVIMNLENLGLVFTVNIFTTY